MPTKEQVLEAAKYSRVEDALKVLFPEHFKVAKEDIGIKDAKGKNIYEGDMYFEEHPQEDGGDIRIFFVITWITEWAMFALLSMGELPAYENSGISVLDDSMRNTYVLSEGEFKNLHYKGNTFENKKLLEIEMDRCHLEHRKRMHQS